MDSFSHIVSMILKEYCNDDEKSKAEVHIANVGFVRKTESKNESRIRITEADVRAW